jgi:hypothetical protein
VSVNVRLCGNRQYLTVSRRLSPALGAKRAFDAIMGMKKIDIAAIKAARRG